MNISKLNSLIDRILKQTLGIDRIEDDKLIDIIEYVADVCSATLNTPPIKTKNWVKFIIKEKYKKKIFLYDNDSKFNKLIVDIPLTKKQCTIDYKDLINHSHDYPHHKFKEDIYKNRSSIVDHIKTIPQFEQKSEAWLKQRTECITATAVAVVLDESVYEHPIKIFLDKCGRGEPFTENEHVHHGKKYEEIATMYYSFRNNVKVAEYGLLQHEKTRFIGASPDGICEKYCYDGQGLSTLVGRLLEIKCPKVRKIKTTGKLDGDICPHYYYLQCQAQMYVTGLTECDFLQCEINEYNSWEEYIEDTKNNFYGLSKKSGLEKGCLIQLLPKLMINDADTKMCLYHGKYIYPPKLHMTFEEIKEWIANETINFYKTETAKDYVIDRVIYWRLDKVACDLIEYESDRMEQWIPIMEQFWEYVIFYRQHPDKLDKLVKYISENGGIDKWEDTKELFGLIHKEYIKENPKSKFKVQLYNTDSEYTKKVKLERKKKKEMKERYARYRGNYGNNNDNDGIEDNYGVGRYRFVD